MRVSALVCAVSVVALAVTTPVPAGAAPPDAAAVPAGAARPALASPAALEPGGRTVTLVTGQRVHVSGPAGRERISTTPQAGAAAAR